VLHPSGKATCFLKRAEKSEDRESEKKKERRRKRKEEMEYAVNQRVEGRG